MDKLLETCPSKSFTHVNTETQYHSAIDYAITYEKSAAFYKNQRGDFRGRLSLLGENFPPTGF